MKGKILMIVIALFVIVASGLVFFQVDEREYVVITQFGEPIKAIKKAGLNLKWPDPIQSVNRYNNRLMTYEMGETEYLTGDKKNVMVDSYVVWRIEDPIKFMKTVKNRLGAETRLADILSSEIGISLGKYDLSSLISTEPEQIKFGKMMKEVKEEISKKARDYGTQIADVKITLLNFPERNKLSVFKRMRAERERIAKGYRSEGTEKALKIRADADKQKEIILSRAYERAQKIKGEGEAQAIRIYAEAYEKDINFYELVRTLESYEKFIDGKTTVVLSADSELLKFINTSNPDLLNISKTEKPLAQSRLKTDEEG
ncbi:MAG: protease modulator HflC [Deltaproteobacteria bacterium]|nr:protease modulator HflC [Deltaproteobacteria bacterium]MBW2154146.1 protease modulator HflC [Deltaproteobacteria bacterium]